MKAKWLIGLVVFLVSGTVQEEQDVKLFVGYKDCYNKEGDTPVTISMPEALYQKAVPVLSANGMVLRTSDEPSPDGGDRAYVEYKGRVPGNPDNVTISVSLQDRETKKTTFLFTKTFISCGNNE